MNVVLIGLRGTGKSTVAQHLAARLAWPWFDADAEIEARAGKSIARIFAEDGEPAFRDLESDVVRELAARDSCILALGGGAVVRSENRRAIGPASRVVWLTATPPTLWGRLRSDERTATGRPNLSAAGGINEIIATLDAREPIYRACAHLIVDTEAKSAVEVADAIVTQLGLVPDG